MLRKILYIAVVIVATPVIFWEIWYRVTGDVPKFLWISRQILDTVFILPCVIAMAIYVEAFKDRRKELSHGEKWDVSFFEVVVESPGMSICGVLLMVACLVGIWYSFLAFYLAVLAFAAATLASWGLYRLGYGLLQRTAFAVHRFVCMVFGQAELADDETVDEATLK